MRHCGGTRPAEREPEGTRGQRRTWLELDGPQSQKWKTAAFKTGQKIYLRGENDTVCLGLGAFGSDSLDFKP
jgi:hypothetical protein